jgi:hypothetical protein
MISHEELKRVIRYEPDTGRFVWLAKVGHSKVGSIAGSRHSRGYWQVWIAGQQYMAHRLALFYVYGCWPSHDVDHINGIRDDNRLSNLREVSRGLNMQNQRLARVDSSTGLLGVVPNRARFAAQIRTNGKTVCLGTYDTPEEAHAAYVRAKRVHHVAGEL